MDDPETYSDPDEPDYFDANRYFSIGQNEETNEESYCWIFDGRQLRVKKGGTHQMNFRDLFDFQSGRGENLYRGWYDPIQNMISIVTPRGEGNWDPARAAASLPTRLRVALSDHFGTNNQIEVF